MIKSFRSRALAQAFSGNTRGIQPNVAGRVRNILFVLHSADSLESLKSLSGFHPLTGNRAGDYSVTVTRNWRITFRVGIVEITEPETGTKSEEFHVYKVDYEDYH